MWGGKSKGGRVRESGRRERGLGRVEEEKEGEWRRREESAGKYRVKRKQKGMGGKKERGIERSKEDVMKKKKE